MIYSAIAQLVEQLTVNQLVAGSSPACGAIIIPSQNNKYLKRQRLYLSRSLHPLDLLIFGATNALPLGNIIRLPIDSGALI
jgi:hypothetical protein